MPADNPPRRITIVKVPYNYEWPGRSAVTCWREPGEYMVKGEVADHATRTGYAVEGWASASKGKTTRRKSVTKKADAATDNRTDAGMAGTDVSAHDRPGVRGAVDKAAG